MEWEYTYDANGMRTSRTSDNKSYEYVYSGDKLVQMTIKNHATNTDQLLEFTYDAAGQPLTLTLDGTLYYYLLNIQGDVMGLVDGNGNLMTALSYTAYGRAYSINNVSSISSTLASSNPLTYRGYVLDAGTGHYYLQSRYYDPALGRFISEDIYVATGQKFVGCNMFSYCLNNPINYIDSSGMDAILIHEWKSARGAGHSGLIVQDEDGVWYFFYWGASNIDADDGSLISNKSARCELVKLDTDGLDMTTLQGVKEALNRAGETDSFVGSRADLIGTTIYWEGDYSNTYSYLNLLKDNPTNIKYNLIANNCVQQVFFALSLSDPRFWGTIPVIPNLSIWQAIGRTLIDPIQIGPGLRIGVDKWQLRVLK